MNEENRRILVGNRTPKGFGGLIPVLLTLIFLGGSFFVIFFLIRNPPQQEIRVTAVIKAIANDSEFWEVIKTGMRAGADEFGLDLDIQGPWAESDVEGQIRIVKNILEDRPPTVLILAAADYTRLAPLVEVAVAAGVKVIAMDSGVDSPLPRTFVATDNVEGGQKVAAEMIRILEPGRKLAIISHVRGTTTAIDRERGVRGVLEKDGRYPILGTWFTDNFADRAYTITAEILREHPDLGGILTMNEISTIGAAQALLDSGAAGKIRLVGFDNPLGRINLIEEGIIAAVVIQKPFNMGYLAVRAARDAAENRDLPPFIDTGSVLIRLENLYEPENQKLLFPFVE
ncbi:MAG: substrate-binding domain-containing protein [Spirochaetaceae bacterium]|jgi:ribose transport system substrate-binding protein|nr:substrate-binding domain-containing protein [Spirochaetaceae bacterium]